MLDYAKAVLPKVVLWKNLFRKELIKCIQWAEQDEKRELYQWCHQNFFKIYPDILTDVYSLVDTTTKVRDKQNKITVHDFTRTRIVNNKISEKIS